jgi:hypothetical protein
VINYAFNKSSCFAVWHVAMPRCRRGAQYRERMPRRDPLSRSDMASGELATTNHSHRSRITDHSGIWDQVSVAEVGRARGVGTPLDVGIDRGVEVALVVTVGEGVAVGIGVGIAVVGAGVGVSRLCIHTLESVCRVVFLSPVHPIAEQSGGNYDRQRRYQSQSKRHLERRAKCSKR